MKTSILALAAAAVAPVLAIPPAEFKFPTSANNTELGVAYTFESQTVSVKEAQLFGSNITSKVPQIAVNPSKFRSLADYKGDYVVVMVDPDAPSPDKPTLRFILHWLMTSVSAQTVAGTGSPLAGQKLLQQATGKQAEVPYAPPAPPPTSSAHRYIIYAFAQPANFAIPAAFSGFSAQNRSGFKIDDFVAAASLGAPLAAEYFYVSRQSQVPGTFIGQPGGQFPGGNGNAIFSSSTANKNSSAPGSVSTGSPTALAARPSLAVGGVLGSAALLALAAMV